MERRSDTDQEVLFRSYKNRLAYITINRPNKLNAFTPKVYDQLQAALSRADRDQMTRVVIICGAGKAFSVGQDTSQTNIRSDPLEERERLREQLRTWLKIWNLRKPVIAQVHGYCLGTATQLAAMSDLTVVAKDAEIGWPRFHLGGGGYLGPAWVPFVGPKRAKEMEFVPSSTINGTTAAEWGWANRAVELADLSDVVRDLALKIAQVPSDSLALKKEAINKMVDATGFQQWLLTAADGDALAHSRLKPQALDDQSWKPNTD